MFRNSIIKLLSESVAIISAPVWVEKRAWRTWEIHDRWPENPLTRPRVSLCLVLS